MSKKKKVTAPLSYDPGKGRPREYLAYLNWQEMQALQRLNGGNMERGPMGLPSFPPDWKGSDTSTGNWSGAGGSTTGAGTGGGSDSGGSDSGGSVGGTTSPGATASTTGTTDGTQSSDTAAQQAAATQNAADAAKTSALTEDARKGGIASINVGPMQTPVKIGSGAISQAVASAVPTMPGGGGMGQYNARRGSSTMAVGPTSGVDAFNNIATGSLYGTPPSAARAYDSLENDLNRRALTRAMTPEASTPSISQNAPEGVFGPRIGGGIPSYLSTTSMPGMITTGMPSGYSGIVRERNTTVAYKTPEVNNTTVFKSPPEPVTSVAENYVPTEFETEVPYTPYRPTVASGTYTTPYNAPSPITPQEQANIDRQYQNMGLEDYVGFTAGPASSARLAQVFENYGITGLPAEQQIADVEESYRNKPGEGIYSVGEIVREGEFSYPTKPDGTPVTAEDIASMPYSTQAEIMDKARFERMTDEDYNLTPEQKQRVMAVKVATAPTRNVVVKSILSAIGGIAGLAENIPGGVGEAASTVKRGAKSLSDPAEAMADYFRLDPLQKQQFADRAGTGYTTGSGTAYAGRIPTQELGGKGNDFGPSSYGRYPVYSEASYSPSAASEDTGRPAQYYLWDLGVGIPSPGDPDYNEYQKYRRNRGSSTDV